MFRRRKKATQPPSDDGLHLGSDDRSVVKAIKSSDELARQMLERAKGEVVNSPSGTEVTVTVTEDNHHIHGMELMFSLVLLAPEYGLQAGVRFNDSFKFHKI